MSGRSKVPDFLEEYRAAFEAFDVSAIADLFSYPFLITSDADEIDVTVVTTRDAWLPQLERLIAAYRAIGVRSAEAVEVRAAELTLRLAHAVVHWRLTDERGDALYEFDAAYTLADLGHGMLITAIAHNETARLQALAARRRLR